MINILIDADFLFKRIASVEGRKNTGFLKLPEDKIKLVQSVNTSLFYDCLQYKSIGISDISICFDSKPNWRKLEYNDYKAKRIDNPTFDSKVLAETMEEYREFLTNSGINTYKLPKFEADDIIAKLANYYYNNDESVVIISADSDIRQLVKSNPKNFISVYNSFNTEQCHYIDSIVTDKENEIVELEAVDDFDVFSESTSFIKSKFELRNQVVVEPSLILFKKMLSGDKGDNIGSCFKYNGMSFTNIRAESVSKKIPKITKEYIKELYDNEHARISLGIRLLNEVKCKDTSLLSKIDEGIKRNLKLIWLESFVLDADLRETIENLEIKKSSVDFKDGFPLSIFNGTPYETILNTSYSKSI